MHKFFLILFGIFLNLSVFSQSDFFRIYSDSVTGPIQLKTIPTNDGGFLRLSGGSPNLIQKFDSTGIPLWSKGYASAASNHDIIELQNNDLLVSGTYLIANTPTYFLMRIDSVGNLIKAIIDHDTSYVMSYPGDVNIAGITNDNGFVFVGRIRVDSLQRQYPFISKVDSAGNFSWMKYFELDTNTYCDKIRSLKDDDGNIIITGFYHYGNVLNSRQYFFIVKFDYSGNLLWLKHGFQSSKMNGMVNNVVESNGSYYILTMQDTPTFNFNVPHIYRISSLSGDLIWHAQYNFWLGWEENRIYKNNDGRLYFTCRDDSTGSSMNVEIDSAGAILRSVLYQEEFYYWYVINTVELNSGKCVISGFAEDWTGPWGIVLASIDSTYHTTCRSSDILLPTPAYYLDSMITKNHSVYSANVSFTDVTSNIQTYTNSLSFIDFCDYVKTPEIFSRKEFSIYPNPATDQCVVDFKKITNGKLQIFNSLGEKIYSSELRGQTTVDCRLFPRGIYFVRLTNSENVITKKLLVE